jgi:hypothetical protein
MRKGRTALDADVVAAAADCVESSPPALAPTVVASPAAAEVARKDRLVGNFSDMMIVLIWM